MLNVFKASFQKYKRMRSLAKEFVKEVHMNVDESGKESGVNVINMNEQI